LSSILFELLKSAVTEFRSRAQAEVKEEEYRIDSPDNDKRVNVSRTQVDSALDKICPSDISDFQEDVMNYREQIRALIPFCSSPASFRTAWDLRSEALNQWDADTIVDQGGQLLPLNMISRIFQCIQQGVELSKNQRLVLAVRHSEGSYQDKLDDLGRFTYQPPNNTAGMLRYRWCQFLSRKLGIPYLLLAIMWFKTQQPVDNELNHVFMIAPARIINYEKDLADIGASLSHPLELQIIKRSDASVILRQLDSLGETDPNIKARSELPEQLAREWSYDKINNTEKGRKIKKWAQSTGRRCPGTSCRNGTTPQHRV